MSLTHTTSIRLLPMSTTTTTIVTTSNNDDNDDNNSNTNHHLALSILNRLSRRL